MSHQLFQIIPAFQSEARKHRIPVLVATAILSVASLLALGVPLAVKNTAEAWAAGQGYLSWLLAGGLLLLVSLGLQIYGGLRNTAVSERLKAALQSQMFRKLLGQELSFHREHGPGELMSAIYNDIQAVAGLYSRLLPSGISGLLMLLGATLALLRLNPGLAAVLAAATLLSLLVTRLLFSRIRTMSRQINERSGSLYRMINESLHQVVVIRLHRLPGWAVSRVEKEQAVLLDLTVKKQFLQGVMSMTVQLVLAGALLLGWIMLTRQSGPDTFGTQLSALLFGLLLVRQLGSLANLLGTFREAQGAMDRLATLLAPGPEHSPTVASLEPLEEIRIEGLSFSYAKEPVLHNISLVLHKGEQVALTGPNGAGKTTLFNLLAGLETTPAGRIFWNGTDIFQVDRNALLARIAYLPQDSLLGQASIADNIRMGRLDAADAELWQAAERAGVADVIKRHPGGLETVLGSEGSRISGGEKRRIALARLLIRTDADLYLLDEPTEGLDRDSEQAILETALDALRDKTVLVITHRPAVLQRVQRQVRLANGRLQPG